MINNIPKNWTYSESTEMLFYFFQCVEEMLSETTCDTYSLPVHNTMTLIYEIESIYELLRKLNLVKGYYEKYIPVIIDEMINSIENDSLLKKELGLRLDNIRTGFIEAKKNHVLLQRWLSLLQQSCSNSRYIEIHKNEIVRLVTDTKNKKDLSKCVKNYFVSLIYSGFSREYLYNTTRDFFVNERRTINKAELVGDYLGIFERTRTQLRFLILMDLETIEYLGERSDRLQLNRNIVKIDVEKESESISQDKHGKELLEDYEKRKRDKNEHRKISIVRYTANKSDKYTAIEELDDLLVFLQSFSRYFKHYNSKRQIFKVLVENEDSSYSVLDMPKKLRKRPYIIQDDINRKLTHIFNSDGLSNIAFSTLAGAFQLHAEALDSKYEIAMLRNFWTSLETLFSNPSIEEERENVIQSILSIIQKTYVLKLLRTVYYQLSDAIGSRTLEALDIASFHNFVKYFAENTENSDRMKLIYEHLDTNPLLRTRIFDLRKRLGTGKSISELLANHQTRIEWQLQRIYRARNVATYVGVEMWYTRNIVDNLHAYFDYIVNFIICKIENEDSISNISALVFESKIDNQIHLELLKNIEMLNGDNYLKVLFGPDTKIVNYTFEYNIPPTPRTVDPARGGSDV